jgi:hypothetical protein
MESGAAFVNDIGTIALIASARRGPLVAGRGKHRALSFFVF